MHPIVTKIVKMFISHPTLNISTVVIFAMSNAIAFGAVETGSINVNEHTNVVGRHKYIGFIQR